MGHASHTWALVYNEKTLQNLIECTAMALDTWANDRRLTGSRNHLNMYPYGVLDILGALGFTYGENVEDSFAALQLAKDQMITAQTAKIKARVKPPVTFDQILQDFDPTCILTRSYDGEIFTVREFREAYPDVTRLTPDSSYYLGWLWVFSVDDHQYQINATIDRLTP